MKNYGENITDLLQDGADYLCLDAAKDLNNYSRNKLNEGNSIKKLAGLLDSLTEEKILDSRTDISLIMTYVLFGRENPKINWKGKTIDDLVIRTKLAANELKDYERASPKRLKELIHFCCELCDKISNKNFEDNYHPRLTA